MKPNGISNKEDLVKKVANKLNIVFEGPVESSSSSIIKNWKYPKLDQQYNAMKFKSWVYACCRRNARQTDKNKDNLDKLVEDICNTADHWTRHCTFFSKIDFFRHCIWLKSGDEQRQFVKGGETYEAIKKWLYGHITKNIFFLY